MTEGEERLYYWATGRSGSFYTALFDMIGKADDVNKMKLAKGFPEEVAAFKRYQEEPGGWEAIQKEMKESK